MKLIAEALKILESTGSLPPEYKPHKLVGKYAGKWECHIQRHIAEMNVKKRASALGARLL